MTKNNLLKSVTSGISKAVRSLGRNKPLPRKGLWSFANTVLNKKQEKPIQINANTLKKLSDTDPITWAIKRVIKSYISQTPWDVVADTADIEAELNRWEDTIITSINPYGISTPPFISKLLDPQLKAEIQSHLDKILLTPAEDVEKRSKVRWLFKAYGKKVRQDAEAHKHEVKKYFEHPNNTDTSFRTFLELVLDDVLTYDAGVIVKNYDHFNRLAELYTLPGHEVKKYLNEDGTVPEEPEPAYVWEQSGILRAEFVNGELIYIMQNPHHNGYGKSPLEVAAYIITAGLYADQYNIEYFKESNVPPGIVNLGEGVSEDQRILFQKMWEQEIQGRGNLHKLIFTAGSDKLQFVPMRNMSNRDMQMMEYLKWAAQIKCACYGLSLQDIGLTQDFHRTTSETQEALSQRRGIKTVLNLLECAFNEEIVKCEFPFSDVKFQWQTSDRKDNLQQAQVDKIDIDNGVVSINERRERLGLKPVEGGDQYVIKGGTGLVPVEDLEKLGDPIEQQQQQMAPGLFDQGFPMPGGMKPGPDADPRVNGEAGRPTGEEEAENEINDALNVSVNRKSSLKTQKEHLNKVIEEMKKKGINAVLRIGFDDDVEKQNP